MIESYKRRWRDKIYKQNSTKTGNIRVSQMAFCCLPMGQCTIRPQNNENKPNQSWSFRPTLWRLRPWYP